MSLASISGVDSLFLNGDLLQSDVVQILQDASISRSIDGASTLTLALYDDNSTLLKSGLFSKKVVANIDEFRFELVQIRKSGFNLSITFEDLPVAALRRHTLPLKVAPNTTTHIDFAERLVKEEGWLKFWVPPGLRSSERAMVELTRGDPTSSDEPEDSWQALGRIADERGWRRYVLDKDTIAYTPETFLLSQDPIYTVQENSVGVDSVDFDFDSGKPVSTVTVTARASRWEVPIGSTVLIEGMGPADGKWLVSEMSRSLFDVSVTISLTQARPVIPEAHPTSTSFSQTTSGGSSSSSGSQPSTSWWNILGNNSTRQPSTSWWNFTGGSAQSTWPDDPSNVVLIGQGGHRLAVPAAASFARVEKAFGRQIKVTDSYRSVASQRANYLRDPRRFGPPGDSAHGEARAVDVNLPAVGVGNQSPDPRKWDKDPVWKKLNDAFMAEGWCNYQYHKGSTDGRVAEPWHWSYQVCK